MRHYSPPRVWYALHKRKQRLGATPTVAPPALPPHNTVAPGAPTGTAAVGSTLTYADYGTWTGGPTSYDIQWYANGVAIPFQVGTTDVVRLEDAGYTITYLVTAHNSGGASSQMSAASGVVTGGGDPTDFTLTGDTTTDAAASGSLVGVLSSSGSTTRTTDITLTGNTTTDAAASGSLVGTLS